MTGHNPEQIAETHEMLLTAIIIENDATDPAAAEFGTAVRD
ncbi:hypothetical protein [Rhizobium gallicum]|nr:hypothetical protein [Rhizobium gallicum]